ncbi:prolipoprotein diacylglyceryl transferase family protein [Halanaerobacter jeridensis]|uniref:Phosphatidylglycerol:prolipoprotein diacylglycerol transferase n=1 Tax=Halanaerobacter jeridensis TaxID=706427 RepID=A0A939BQL5_9FIRM|nr:prolipoprotein diacylglyceryl transferase family protein [Halanaerobacter jeridensis]MBM7556464.1 phosphatidylglycerol:prolipoprotein diacylglycerol transferase [Halanaerobacter jeridensis]
MDPYLIEYKSLALSWFLFLTLIAGVIANFISKFQLQDILSQEEREDLNFYVIIFAVIGSRLLYVLLNWPFYQKNLLATFELSHLTLNLTGALLGGVVIVFYFSWQNNKDFWQLSSRYTSIITVALMIGSWTYYFEGQLNFLVTLLLSLWWAFIAAVQFLILDYKDSKKSILTLFVIAYGIVRIFI